MAERSIVLNTGIGGHILQETTAAVINIHVQLRFVIIAGYDVIALFKHQRGRAAGIPGGYIIPIAFIRAFIQGNSHFSVDIAPKNDITGACCKSSARDIQENRAAAYIVITIRNNVRRGSLDRKSVV